MTRTPTQRTGRPNQGTQPSKGKGKEVKLSPGQVAEWEKCQADTVYFVENYVRIFNATIKRWIPFALWEAQEEVLDAFVLEKLLISLKARQLGLTWLTLAHFLAQMLFHPAATILIFSKRDDEAVELLCERLKLMHDNLPEWMQQRVTKSNDHLWKLANGSSAIALPTTGGRSYTASHVLVDEADYMINLGAMINAIQPTVDAGGQMILISTVDKDKPESVFKNMFRAAVDQQTDYFPIFLPWYARPTRTKEWYQARVRDSLAKTSSMDSVYQEYPATVEEALMPNTANKRLRPSWLAMAFEDRRWEPVGPALADHLNVYVVPVPGKSYVIGADTAEGNPSSDDSALTVLDMITGEEVAMVRGKIEPAILAQYIDKVSAYYNNAPALVERNNHGHAVLLALYASKKTRRLRGLDGKAGWNTIPTTKVILYDSLAETLRNNAEDGQQAKLIHSKDTFYQLASIETLTLSAPEGQMDDLAISYALADRARPIAAAMGTARTPQSQTGVAA